MCLLFTLVTGNCDILECAPVLLIALQCQFLGSGKDMREKRETCQTSDGTPIFFISGQEGEWRRGDHK